MRSVGCGPVRPLPGVQALVGARAGQDESLADLRRAERCGARLVVPEDDEWPALALHALTLAVAEEPGDRRSQADRTVALVPPVGLWVRGAARLDELADRSVAVVGSRASTAYGEHVAGELGHRLGERGWTVVSGGAYGIDAAAHRGALAAEAPTVAVLACGIDRVYPAANGALLARIADTGMLISEWPPGCAPLAAPLPGAQPADRRADPRHRRRRGRGSFGGAGDRRRAQRLGRRVMVVPGPVTSAMSVGCHELLREKEADAVSGRPRRRTSSRRSAASETTWPMPAERPDQPSRRALRRRCPGAGRLPVRIGVSPERLAATPGVDVLDVLRVLPALELAELVQWTGSGWRLAPPPKRRPRVRAGRRGGLTGPGAPTDGSARDHGDSGRAGGASRRRWPRRWPATRTTCAPSGTCPSTRSAATSPTPCGCSTTWPAAAAQQVHDLDLAALRSWLAQGRTRGHSRATTARHAASARSFTA